MIVLPVPDPGPDVTWIVMGFLLGFIWCGINTAAWWTEANRNDEQEYRLAALESAKAQVTRGEQAPATTTYLGIEITEAPVDGPATQPDIPAQPCDTEPSDLPLQVQTALLAAQTEVVPVDEWSAKWDADMAELRAKWDREDAA